MPGYASRRGRKSPSSRTAGLGRRLGNTRPLNKPVKESLPGAGEANTAIRSRAWDAGAAELEVKMQKYRAKSHVFVKAGKVDMCDRCGLSEHAFLNDTTPLHRRPLPKGKRTR